MNDSRHHKQTLITVKPHWCRGYSTLLYVYMYTCEVKLNLRQDWTSCRSECWSVVRAGSRSLGPWLSEKRAVPVPVEINAHESHVSTIMSQKDTAETRDSSTRMNRSCLNRVAETDETVQRHFCHIRNKSWSATSYYWHKNSELWHTKS